MSFLMRFVVQVLVVAIAPSFVFAQDTKQGLARPEWQLRADLEFRLSCQTSLQKLCHELVQTYRSDPDDPANTKLLESVNELLETKDGKLPSNVPDHPASVEYAKERRAAVVEWSKVYKAKGRDLPKLVLDAERTFQEKYREADEDSANADAPSVVDSIGTGSASTSPISSSSKNGKRNAGSSTRSAEKKLTEATINGMVRLIKEVDKYRSYTPVGDTTLEKNAARENARESFFNFVKAQPDYYLTYTIVDVTGEGTSLTFTVEEAIEFDAIRQQIGDQLQLSHHQKEITVKTSQTQKLVLPIKPGDLLWVRMKIDFRGFRDRDSYKEAPYFFVTHSGKIGDRTLGGNDSQFSIKSIVGFQVLTQSSSAGTSK